MDTHDKQQATPRPGRPVSTDTGNWGEEVAASWLVAQGYAIREVKWKGPSYEIDIIAQRGTRIAFVEVKTRANRTTDPAAAVDTKKRQRMIHAADVYLRALKLPLDYQFDIISITGNRQDYTLEYIPDAFFPSPRQRRSF